MTKNKYIIPLILSLFLLTSCEGNNPPSDGGNDTTPIVDGGSETTTPPVDGGTETTPPVDGGTETTPPIDGGTETTPPVEVQQNLIKSMTAKDWNIVWHGYGEVSFDSDGILQAPQVSTRKNETHATLVTSKYTDENPMSDFDITLEVTNEAQLRENDPANAWEVFWLFFNLKVNPDQTKESNYLIIKPNGIELGTAYGELGQKYLYTKGSPSRPIGVRYKLRVQKKGQTVKAWLDDVLVLDHTDSRLYQRAGSIGLYNEDAKVRVHSAVLAP